MNSFYVELDNLDLMSVTGIDSEKFLQGQLTCDVETITIEQSSLAAVCDNKGRVIASFRLCQFGENAENSYFLEMQPGLLDLLKPTLDKYGVFYKATLNNASSKFLRYGLAGSESKTLLSSLFPCMPERINQVVSVNSAHLIKISDSPVRFELWLDASKPLDTLKKIQQELSLKDYSAWELLDIHAGFFPIEAADSGIFTPQVLNYDLAGLISFKKGCYTGQEIVARMHYRGKAKRRLYHLAVESEQEIKVKEIIHTQQEGTEIGQIIKIRKNEQNHYDALAILKTEVENNATFGKLGLKNHSHAKVEVIQLDYPN